MQPHILFVSTSNLATNPRLLKEIQLALDKGYHITAVICYFHNWSRSINESEKQKLKSRVKLIEVAADRSSFLAWVGSSILQKLQQFKSNLGFCNSRVLSDVLIKRSILLRWKLKKLKSEFQLVIAHNPGAFEPVAAYAKKHNIPFGIDLEDYHPGEITVEKHSQKMKQLMQHLLPQAAYISAAAPLILEAAQKDCRYRLKNTLTIHNYFFKEDFMPPVIEKSKPLQCVWFSQNIDIGRGLEALLVALKSFQYEVHLHLYGNINPLFYELYLADNPQVFVHDPVTQKELHRLLAGYDIGLALEDVTVNFNRNICITNKLLAYYQAGLFILASDTAGQIQFMQQHPSQGIITSLSNLKQVLKQIVQQKESIRSEAQARHIAAENHHAADELRNLSDLWDLFLK
jgi:hypothetical protein